MEKFPSKEQIKKKLSWKELPDGAVISVPQSKENKTGSWGSFKPVWDKEKCIHCGLCALFCPENCIPVKDGKRLETNLDYCKGCGICARVCPVKAIKMELKKDK